MGVAEFIEVSGAIPIGGTGLVALAVISIYRGWLVPKGTMERLLAAKDEVNAELRRTNQAVTARADLLAEQIRALTDGVKTSNAVVTALPVARREAS